MDVNAVFKGGGVKGIALVGAISVLESQGLTWHNVAGTSAGAITGALLAAGVDAATMKSIVFDMDFKQFEDGPHKWEAQAVELYLHHGVYKGDFFHQWMEQQLEQALQCPGPITFSQLKRPLQVCASDVTNRRLLVLPHDLSAPTYGYDNPAAFAVADAVRASMSIPYFFYPYQLAQHTGQATLVDGGLLDNYPLNLMAPGARLAEYPTIGFFLQAPADGQPTPTGTLIEYSKGLAETALEGWDNTLMAEDPYWAKSIIIPTGKYSTTDFDLSEQDKENLFQYGVDAATAWWNRLDNQVWLNSFPRLK